LWHNRRRGLWRWDRLCCNRSRTLLDCAWASDCAARNEQEVDHEYEKHQDACEIDRRLDEEIGSAANAEHCAYSAWGRESAGEALALCCLSKYNKSEKDRYDDRENYCNRIHLKKLKLRGYGADGLNSPIFCPS
jgi:hypothetical protein